jgi:hypothetical protein
VTTFENTQVMAPLDLVRFAADLPGKDQLGRKSSNLRLGPFVYTPLFSCVFLSLGGRNFVSPASFKSDRIAR